MNQIEKNEALVMNLYDSFALRDTEALSNICHPEILWIQMPGFPGGTTSIGINEIITNVFDGNSSRWASFSFSKTKTSAYEDLVIVQGEYIVTAHDTNRPAQALTTHIFSIEDGKVYKFQQFTDTKVLWDCYTNK